MAKVTIVMYHYVRDLKHSRYPEIKGLDIELFKEQIQYILKYYKVIRMEELIEAVKNQTKLPNNSLLLTFDDAYEDHFEFVFPILDELGIQGSFFPPAKAIQEHQVLNVNKIHFILASVEDKKRIISYIHSVMDKFREEYSLESNTYYDNKLKAEECRFDTIEAVF
ncbi:MAG: polysaccharide deacetylase, partial [Bacteroidetes bacterium]